uniref:Dolichyl-diphosphooligosaccharide--protein glycosyltransferase 48 kDa subunit n=1 Tax=Physcomitrium patens TaxID=3218 RepID=A0A7I4CPW3_PHYPA
MKSGCQSNIFKLDEALREVDGYLLVTEYLYPNMSMRESCDSRRHVQADRGYELDVKLATDPKLTLQSYGSYHYDALILFAPKVESLGGNLDAAAISDFVDSGHDLILAADETTSDTIREIASDCGVDFDEFEKAVVIDHVKYAITPLGDDHSLIAADNLIDSTVILGSQGIKEPILYRGLGHIVNPTSELGIKVLSASPSAYSGRVGAEITDLPNVSGASMALVSVVQARNNARIMISGSLELFSNQFFESSVQQSGSDDKFEKSGNQQFAVELTKWTLHERGHLKTSNVHHHKIGETNEPAMYRIADNARYSLGIQEWNGKDWQPYQADDVQLQFYMMSPYVLKTLSHDGKGLYFTEFQVPDVYGVFQFKVEYNRLGYTTLNLAKQIPVRPFRHDEYERFIPAAFPYYGASFSTMIAFFVFGIVFLYHK